MPAVTMYFDTADLSYLALGKLPGHGHAAAIALRDELVALVRADLLSVRLSLFHAAEIVLRAKVAAAAQGALAALAESAGLTWLFTSPEAIFAAELADTTPMLEEGPLAPADRESRLRDRARRSRCG